MGVVSCRGKADLLHIDIPTTLEIYPEYHSCPCYNIYITDSLLVSERSELDTLRSVQSRIADIYIYNWRASEASETLSGLFNRESRIYIYYILGMCSFQHKWATERQLYLFVLPHHVIMK